MFVGKLMSLIFSKETGELSIRVYPEETIKFLLKADIFSKDLLPGGANGLVPAALGNKKFLKRLLEQQPTPFAYGDYLLLVKYILETPKSTKIVSTLSILDAFERDIDTFFDRSDMRTVLSTDQLQQFLQILTTDPEIVPYPALLCQVLDAIGLGPLILTQSLPAELIDTLNATLESESSTLSTCLETSSLLSLILQRHNDVPTTRKKDRTILYNDRKRKLGEAGWLEAVAQEGGMTRQRRTWMRKPALPGSGKELRTGLSQPQNLGGTSI